MPPSIPDPGHFMDALIDARAVKPLIDALPPRGKHTLLLRFSADRSQAEIAGELGISQMHVSRILRAVLTQIRQALTAQ
ncbi:MULTISPECIES: sigma-70 family RNA polymerase sigma factor [unclassified Nonomuraea]|uniref:sigma-70 family RNA polymerase sigma factor n=1 Tax=unclassified Nonomuraea TaxID=2593643 RepID=UPI0035BF492A